MKKFVMNRDRKFSIGMLIFSLLMMWQTSQISAAYSNIDGSDPGSKLFPYIVCILLFVCSIGKFITCNKPDTSKFVGGATGLIRIAKCLAILCLYTFLLNKIGFILVTFLATLTLLYVMKLDRKVRLPFAVLFSGVTTAVLYILFQVVLQVILPTGTVWNAFF